VNGALSIIKPSFCGFREQCVTSVNKIFIALSVFIIFIRVICVPFFSNC